MEGLGAGAVSPLSPGPLKGPSRAPAQGTRLPAHSISLAWARRRLPSLLMGGGRKSLRAVELSRGLCFPSAPLTLLPSPSRCAGEDGGRMCWACARVREDWGASPAWPDCTRTAEWWLLQPLPGGHSVEQIPAVQRGPERWHLRALPICTVPSITPVQTFAASCLARQRIKLLFVEKMLSPVPSPASFPLSLIVILA